jgi:ParB-like chromosome segregation protein Spo0J
MTHNVRPELAALLVPIDRLRPHPDNPNNGDTDAIVESLRRNGLYRPVVAWRQPDGTGVILAGNHTYAAALSLHWTHLAATWVDADDPDDARRIMLADNRYAQLARMDDGALAELLQSLDTLDGTGYTDPDLDRILARVDRPYTPDTRPTCPGCGKPLPLPHMCHTLSVIH